MTDDKKLLKITNTNGEKMEYEIISVFYLDKTGKNYVVYTDNTNDEQGNLNIFASIYYPDDDSKLDSIETEEEWDAVESLLATLK